MSLPNIIGNVIGQRAILPSKIDQFLSISKHTTGAIKRIIGKVEMFSGLGYLFTNILT